MKNTLLLLSFLVIGNFCLAQSDSIQSKESLEFEKKRLSSTIKKFQDSLETVKGELNKYKPVKYWKIRGTNSLIFNQSSFSNWVAGGLNSMGLNARVNYNIDYKKGNNYVENKIILGYGVQANADQKPKKTEDIISLSSTYGRKLNKKWYATANATFLTQFVEGFDYDATPNARDGEQISNFMAPGYVTVGLGFNYNPNDNFQAYLRPASSKMTFVTDEILQKKGNYGLKNDGDSFLFELGASAGATHKGKISSDVAFIHSINLFSNYLNHAERVDIFYSAEIDMKINKFISSQFTINLLYDHDQIKRTQLKQTLGVGFAYNIE
ncbi:MAG: DUF3078 domain-containing protein [Flavobacteriales bacterium]|nr:DUF3078 domain-containing protein [Flavobacteriales bacterium]